MQAHDIIATLRCRGVTPLATASKKLRVESVELLTETEKATLKAHKPALLQTLRQSAETLNERQSKTVSRMPQLNEHSGAMVTGAKYGLYAPNCNRCRRYRWRSATYQQQGRVAFANTPPLYLDSDLPIMRRNPRLIIGPETGQDVPALRPFEPATQIVARCPHSPLSSNGIGGPPWATPWMHKAEPG